MLCSHFRTQMPYVWGVAGESGDPRGVALLIDVVSAFLVVGAAGLALFSAAAALTIVEGSADARLFFECLFS